MRTAAYLSAVDVVEYEVESVWSLEGVAERNEERMTDVGDEDVPLRHDVLSLVPLHDVGLVENLHRVEAALSLVACQQHLNRSNCGRDGPIVGGMVQLWEGWSNCGRDGPIVGGMVQLWEGWSNCGRDGPIVGGMVQLWEGWSNCGRDGPIVGGTVQL